MLKYPPRTGTCSQSLANVNRQSARASGDNGPGDSTCSGWGFYFLSFSSLHPAKFRLNELCVTKLPPWEEMPRHSQGAHEGSIRHCWSLSHTQRSLEIGTGGTPRCFKHCKRWLTGQTQEFLAITEPFHRAQLHYFTLQKCSRSLRKSLWQQNNSNQIKTFTTMSFGLLAFSVGWLEFLAFSFSLSGVRKLGFVFWFRVVFFFFKV